MAFFGKKKGRAGRIALLGPLAGAFGGKKKGQEFITPPPYTGPRPLTLAEARSQMPFLTNYETDLAQKARGQGRLGFDPARRDILRHEFLSDFGDYSADLQAKASAQASGQGLRGGIPIENQNFLNRTLARSRESGLASIDTEDLAARREDENRAFYAQPQLAQQESGIQGNAADFGLSEYNATLPQYIEDQPSDVLPALVGAAGTIGGAYVGRPDLGALAGQIAASQIAGQGGYGGNQNTYGNKSLARSRRYNYSDPILTSSGYGYRY